MAWKWG